MSVVPLFVDPEIEPLKGEEGSTILRSLELAAGFILFVGSMRRHKNWEGLIRAYASLPESLRRSHSLVFAGRAARSRDAAAELSVSLGLGDQVRILGVVNESELMALYGGAAILACPSFMEGFGFPPLEAMACGVPVVASDRTCIPEVLGDAAMYVDPSSVASMTDGLERVLCDVNRRESMIDAGLKQAATYNPARTAAAMSDVLELVGGTG